MGCRKQKKSYRYLLPFEQKCNVTDRQTDKPRNGNIDNSQITEESVRYSLERYEVATCQVSSAAVRKVAARDDNEKRKNSVNSTVHRADCFVHAMMFSLHVRVSTVCVYLYRQVYVSEGVPLHCWVCIFERSFLTVGELLL